MSVMTANVRDQDVPRAHMGSDLSTRVDQALDSIRPYLRADGGDVRLIEVTDEGVARLELLGACHTCPMSPMTLKAGVEEAIRHAVPEIVRIEAVTAPELDPLNRA